MTKQKSTNTTTRRHLLTIAAGGAVAAAIPADARAYPGHAADPIFAAIDAFRWADASCVAVHGDIPDELGDRRGDAIRAVMRTCPTTPAGLVALTGWTREQADWLEKNGSNLFADDLSALTATIDDAARGMSGLEPWSPPLQAAAAVSADPALRAIAAHRQAARIFNEVVVEYGNCSIDRHLEATAAPRDAMFAAGDALVKTKPTTMAGAVAMLRYLSTLYDEIGTGTECSVMPDTIDTSDDEQEAWQVLAFRTLASALMEVQS